MRDNEADWTLFWRQLAELRGRVGSEPQAAAVDDATLQQVMMPAFYSNSALAASDVSLWLQSQWIPAVTSSGADAAAASSSMKQASPKYVPREWMLVSAYKAADAGDYAPLRTLHTLFKTP